MNMLDRTISAFCYAVVSAESVSISAQQASTQDKNSGAAEAASASCHCGSRLPANMAADFVMQEIHNLPDYLKFPFRILAVALNVFCMIFALSSFPMLNPARRLKMIRLFKKVPGPSGDFILALDTLCHFCLFTHLQTGITHHMAQCCNCANPAAEQANVNTADNGKDCGNNSK